MPGLTSCRLGPQCWLVRILRAQAGMWRKRTPAASLACLLLRLTWFSVLARCLHTALVENRRPASRPGPLARLGYELCEECRLGGDLLRGSGYGLGKTDRLSAPGVGWRALDRGSDLGADTGEVLHDGRVVGLEEKGAAESLERVVGAAELLVGGSQIVPSAGVSGLAR